jgi:hypothetical protein
MAKPSADADAGRNEAGTDAAQGSDAGTDAAPGTDACEPPSDASCCPALAAIPGYWPGPANVCDSLPCGVVGFCSDQAGAQMIEQMIEQYWPGCVECVIDVDPNCPGGYNCIWTCPYDWCPPRFQVLCTIAESGVLDWIGICGGGV